MRRALQLCLAFLACLLTTVAVYAQYPDKTITLVVPFPPGGVADTVARPVAEAMARELKQPVVIDNKSGAGGAVGIGHAARSAPDGYTLLLSLSSISILPEADKILDRKPLFPRFSSCARTRNGRHSRTSSPTRSASLLRTTTAAQEITGRCTFRWRC